MRNNYTRENPLPLAMLTLNDGYLAALLIFIKPKSLACTDGKYSHNDVDSAQSVLYLGNICAYF